MGASITYSGLARLNTALGSGGDTFFVASTSSATSTHQESVTCDCTVDVCSSDGPTSVSTGAGDDTVNVGSVAPTAGGVVDRSEERRVGKGSRSRWLTDH